MTGMMVLFHCESNPGFAPSTHEHTFFKVAERLVGDAARIHYAYSSIERGMTPSMVGKVTNVIQLNTLRSDAESLARTEQYIREHGITLLLGFDQPAKRPLYQSMRRGGLRHFVSYWGASMSSLNTGPKLWLKRMEMSLPNDGPDHYVFQSHDMRRTATHGRGIPEHKTSVVRTGIDTERFRPDAADALYAHQTIGIPEDRRIVFFSGHMEERKGVHIVLKAAVHLINTLNVRGVHFLILGNREGEKERFKEIYEGTPAEDHITFGGYRNDVPRLLRSCTVGMIASTVWDSFPMSSLEMSATELPLLVSNLPGLRETITPETGRLFPVGDFLNAAGQLKELLEDDAQRLEMGQAGRARVLEQFSNELQVRGIEQEFRKLMNRQ
jgi:glycosyltransferase involved in cell wall biosynthesis